MLGSTYYSRGLLPEENVWGVMLGKESTVADDIIIGKSCTIGRNVNIATGVILGDNVSIMNNVVIYKDCKIHDNVIISSNSRIKTSVCVLRDVFIGESVTVDLCACVCAGASLSKHTWVFPNVVVPPKHRTIVYSIVTNNFGTVSNKRHISVRFLKYWFAKAYDALMYTGLTGIYR